jgi:ethanolamine utilization protein EutP (predicted NTPase)
MIKIAYSGTHGCGKTTAVYNAAFTKKIEEKIKL